MLIGLSYPPQPFVSDVIWSQLIYDPTVLDSDRDEHVRVYNISQLSLYTFWQYNYMVAKYSIQKK